MTSGFSVHQVKIGKRNVKFQVWVPPQIQPPYPTVLFLHGYGETGTDGKKMVTIGLAKALREQPEKWPFLVVFPQKPTTALWPEHVEILRAICSDVSKNYQVDESRLYLTGLSQGGHGTLNLVDQLPWTFAAAAAICGWCDPHAARMKFSDIPLRLYHGMKDDVVAYENSLCLAKELCRVPSVHAELLLYPQDDHNSWDQAYLDSELGGWFLKYSRKESPV